MTSWGNRGSGNGQFTNPYCVAVGNSGNVYVVDTGNNRVQEFTSTGTYVTSWGSSGSGNGQFNYPFGVAVDDSGNVYVADVFNNRIQEFTSTGTYVTSWGSSGSSNGQFNSMRGVAVDDSGNVYVADFGNNRIQKFTSTGTYVTQWGSSGSGNGQFTNPFGVAVDNSGNVYVSDSNNNRVEKFSVSTDNTITFTESGLPSGTSWTVTFNGTQQTSTTNTITFTIDDGTYSWSTSATISGETGTQYVASSASGTMNVPTQTAQSITYTTQYYLTVTSDHGSPSGQNWYNAGATATFGVTSPDVADTTRHVLSSWTSADTGSYTGTAVSASVTMNNPVTETAQWSTQYLMAFSSSGLGGDATGNLVSYSVNGGAMSGDASPISVSGGSFWVDAGATVTYSFVNPVTSSVTGKQYQLDSVTGLTSPITVSGASTLTGNYVTQWQVTFAASGGGSTSPTGSNVWENAGSLNISATANSGYLFSTWSSDTGSITFTNTSSDSTSATIGGTGTITASFATDTLTATETTTDETYPIEINGNVDTEQFSNMTITPYQDTEITSVDFTLTGPSGTEGFCNLTLPKIAIPFGTNPVVYIDGTVAENQSFTQDFDNFYIAFATHFSTHQIEILFSTESNPSYSPMPIITWAPSQTSNTAPNPTAIPTPTIQPTPTTTPRPTTNPTSAPTTTLATLGQYITVAVAIIVLGAVIIGIVQRRKHSTKHF